MRIILKEDSRNEYIEENTKNNIEDQVKPYTTYKDEVIKSQMEDLHIRMNVVEPKYMRFIKKRK